MAARDGLSDGIGSSGQVLRRHIRDARCGFGLAVHQDQIPTRCLPRRMQAPGQRGVKPPARLRHIAQGWQRHEGIVPGVQSLDLERHKCEAGHTQFPRPIPKVRGRHRIRYQRQRGACGQIRMQDGKPVRIEKRKRRSSPVRGAQAKITGDTTCVGRNIGVGKPHEFGVTGTARC